MKTLHLIPQDAWFFRDGRPYTKEENDQSDVESLFPPFPSTLSGALRVALARNAPEHPWKEGKRWPSELNHVLGDDTDELGEIRFVGPFLHHRCHGLLFPAPLSLLGKPTPEAESPFTGLTLLAPGETIETDAGRCRLPKADPPEGSKNTEGYWISSDGLKAILNGRPPADRDLMQPGKLWAHESRVGLVRDATTHTVGHAALYSPRYVRLNKKVSLIFRVNGLPENWSIPSSFPLGGEGRTAIVLKPENLESLKLPSLEKAPEGKFILITLTPVVLSAGENSEAAWPVPGKPLLGVDAELVSACLGRPIHIGGWDSRNNKPLPLRPCLPPGCVLFFQGTAPNQSTIQLGDRIAHGYGQCAVGHWPTPN